MSHILRGSDSPRPLVAIAAAVSAPEHRLPMAMIQTPHRPWEARAQACREDAPLFARYRFSDDPCIRRTSRVCRTWLVRCRGIIRKNLRALFHAHLVRFPPGARRRPNQHGSNSPPPRVGLCERHSLRRKKRPCRRPSMLLTAARSVQMANLVSLCVHEACLCLLTVKMHTDSHTECKFCYMRLFNYIESNVSDTTAATLHLYSILAAIITHQRKLGA
jgi:hypothetical protein